MSLPANLTYALLIDEAILALKQRTGSSLHAIKKYLNETYPDFDLQGVSPSYVTAVMIRYSSL